MLRDWLNLAPFLIMGLVLLALSGAVWWAPADRRRPFVLAECIVAILLLPWLWYFLHPVRSTGWLVLRWTICVMPFGLISSVMLLVYGLARAWRVTSEGGPEATAMGRLGARPGQSSLTVKIAQMFLVMLALSPLLLITGFVVEIRRDSWPRATRTSPPALPACPNMQAEAAEAKNRLPDGLEAQLIIFRTTDPPGVVLTYYRDHLRREGWESIGQSATESTFDNTQACPLYRLHIATTLVEMDTMTQVQLELRGERCFGA